MFLLDPDQTTYINLVIVLSFCLYHVFPSSTNSNTLTLEVSHLFPKMWNVWGLERRIKQRRFGKITKWKWECQIVQFVDSFQKKLWDILRKLTAKNAFREQNWAKIFSTFMEPSSQKNGTISLLQLWLKAEKTMT